MSEAMEVGSKLVDYCRQGKWMDAVNSLYSPNIVSVEPQGGPEMPAKMEGIDPVRGKTEWWEQNHEVHNVTVEGPYPHGDRFIVRFKLEVTPKAGPMAGKRMAMDEMGLYTVKDGKVAQEEFFYSMGG